MSKAKALGRLDELSGHGPMKVRVETARARLVRIDQFYWRKEQARGRIERFLTRRQVPVEREIADIERAYVARHDERLTENLRHFIDGAMSSDPEFFQHQIAVVRAALAELERKG